MLSISQGGECRTSGETILTKQQEWNGFGAKLVRRVGVRRQTINVTSEHHTFFLNMEGAAKTGETCLDGLRVQFAARPEGSLAYLPPRWTWSGWDEGDARAAYLFIAVEEEYATQLFGDTRALGDLKPNLSFYDLGIQFSARKIASELVQGDVASLMIVEGHLTTIFGHLLRRSNKPNHLATGGLAPAVLRKVLERLDASLEEPIGMAALAREIGISAAHLSRAFKQSVGIPPHTYLISKRLERASRLLQDTSLSVTEIALICGFSSGSHLSTSFKQHLDVHPSAYRSRRLDLNTSKT